MRDEHRRSNADVGTATLDPLPVTLYDTIQPFIERAKYTAKYHTQFRSHHDVNGKFEKHSPILTPEGIEKAQNTKVTDMDLRKFTKKQFKGLMMPAEQRKMLWQFVLARALTLKGIKPYKDRPWDTSVGLSVISWL